MLTEDIRRQAVAKSVTFASLGTAGTSLEKSGDRTYSGIVYRFSGRCVVVDTAGRRRAYSFSGKMNANNYEVNILDIRFAEPRRD